MTAEPMPASQEFVTPDGVSLQIVHYRAAAPIAGIVLFPTALGDACSGLYEQPRRALVERGCSCILYNARGHGKSGGLWSLESCVTDLLAWLDSSAPAYGTAVPLIGVGHSMGATSLLSLAGTRQVFSRVILVAPTLDTREALTYMYDAKTFPEFVDYVRAPAGDNALVEMLFADRRWLDPEYWRNERLRDRLDFPTHGAGKTYFLSLGRFLENVLFPGHNVDQELASVGDRTHVFLPREDHWTSIERTERVTKSLQIPCTKIEAARDHMFSGGWPVVWSRILAEL
jgi:pimeloyl-ACP methyl ester carboxylesterase